MAKKPKTTQTVELIGKCVGCGKKESLSSQQILQGEQDGAALSTCCFLPLVIEKAKFSR